MSNRSLCSLLVAAIMAAALAIIPASPASAASTWYLDPNGGGTSCTFSNPCDSFNDALGVARPGDTVRLKAGSYPQQEIDRSVSWNGSDANITFRPDGGAVTINGIRSYVPALTFRDFNITSILYMDVGADGNVAIGNFIEQAFVTSADDTTWIDNTIKPDRDGPDAMQIKALNGDQPNGVTIIGNRFGPQWREGDSHTDCIQILGGDDIVIERNIMYPCADKALQIRSGVSGVIGDVRIEANFMGECAPRRDECNGYHVAVVAAEGNRIEFIHNSINGSVAFSESGSEPGGSNNVAFYGNIAASLPCTPDSDWNMVEDSACGSNDIVAAPIWRDPSELVQDLHLVTGSRGINAGSPYAPALDIDGQACTSGDIGADQTCGSGGANPNGELAQAVAWLYSVGLTTEGPNVEAFRPNDATSRANAVTFLHRAEGSPGASAGLPSDVDPSRYFAGPVRWGIDTGVVTGFADGTFRPDELVTRGQFATLLWRMVGSPSTPIASLPDVAPNVYYAEAISWAREVGVMNGYGDGTFRPDDPIIRGHLALMLCRFSNTGSLDVSACG